MLGNVSEFQRAVKLVIDNVSFDKDSTVQVFEANIRFLTSYCFHISHTRKHSSIISAIINDPCSHLPVFLTSISALSKGYWEVLSRLTFCWRIPNILLARWALRGTIMSCCTWLMTWLSACCLRLRTQAQAFLTQGWVRQRFVQKFEFDWICLWPFSAHFVSRWTLRLEFLQTASMRLVLPVLGPCWWSLGSWAAWLETLHSNGSPGELSKHFGAWETMKLVC